MAAPSAAAKAKEETQPASAPKPAAPSNLPSSVVSRLKRIEAAAASAAETRQQKEAQSKEWMAKFSPFFDRKSGQHLLIGAAFNRASEAEQEKCRQAFAKANDLMTAYLKAEFPLGKTAQLLSLEETLQERLKQMPEGLRRSQTLVSRDIEKEFGHILNYLAQDTGWKSDTTKKPNIVMARDVTPLQKAIERYAKLATLKQKLAQVQEQDQKNRAVRAERNVDKKPPGK